MAVRWRKQASSGDHDRLTCTSLRASPTRSAPCPAAAVSAVMLLMSSCCSSAANLMPSLPWDPKSRESVHSNDPTVKAVASTSRNLRRRRDIDCVQYTLQHTRAQTDGTSTDLLAKQRTDALVAVARARIACQGRRYACARRVLGTAAEVQPVRFREARLEAR
jgi:hypothetical protein